MLDLKATHGARFRVTLDESAGIDGQTTEDRAWLHQIPGKFGHVYIHGADTLGVYVRTKGDPTDRLGRLLALPGARLHQRGDREATVLVAPENLDAVADVLKLRRRKRLSPEQREALRTRMGKVRAATGKMALDRG